MSTVLLDMVVNAVHNAQKRCIEENIPRLQSTNQPWLAIGSKFATKVSAEKIVRITHVFPFLCDTKEEAKSVLELYDSGFIARVDDVLKKFNIKVKGL